MLVLRLVGPFTASFVSFGGTPFERDTTERERERERRENVERRRRAAPVAGAQ
jgi:hypothetical protein